MRERCVCLWWYIAQCLASMTRQQWCLRKEMNGGVELSPQGATWSFLSWGDHIHNQQHRREYVGSTIGDHLGSFRRLHLPDKCEESYVVVALSPFGGGLVMCLISHRSSSFFFFAFLFYFFFLLLNHVVPFWVT